MIGHTKSKKALVDTPVYSGSQEETVNVTRNFNRPQGALQRSAVQCMLEITDSTLY